MLFDGAIIGPPLGSFLYTIGGFSLPFFVVGSISLVLGVCLCLVIPEVRLDSTKEIIGNNNDKINEKNKVTFFAIFKVSFLIPYKTRLVLDWFHDSGSQFQATLSGIWYEMLGV